MWPGALKDRRSLPPGSRRLDATGRGGLAPDQSRGKADPKFALGPNSHGPEALKPRRNGSSRRGRAPARSGLVSDDLTVDSRELTA
eukprot:4259167-Pyramimonas_sp.AAC.1